MVKLIDTSLQEWSEWTRNQTGYIDTNVDTSNTIVSKDLHLHNAQLLDRNYKWVWLQYLEAFYIKTMSPEINIGLTASKELQLFKWFPWLGYTLREKCPNAEFSCSVFSCIRTEYGKIRTRNNSVFGHFSSSDILYS